MTETETLQQRCGINALRRLVVVKTHILQLSRYFIVSALALSVDLFSYTGLIYFEIRTVLAGIIGYTIGIVVHFVLSFRYVFDAAATRKSDRRLFGEFLLSSVLGLVLTATVIWIMSEVLHQGAAVAKITSIGFSFLAVFVLRRSLFAPSDGGTTARSRTTHSTDLDHRGT